MVEKMLGKKKKNREIWKKCAYPALIGSPGRWTGNKIIFKGGLRHSPLETSLQNLKVLEITALLPLLVTATAFRISFTVDTQTWGRWPPTHGSELLSVPRVSSSEQWTCGLHDLHFLTCQSNLQDDWFIMCFSHIMEKSIFSLIW